MDSEGDRAAAAEMSRSTSLVDDSEIQPHKKVLRRTVEYGSVVGS